MTAEVAVLNKMAVALAADSAVTISSGSQEKVYNTVNKLFALSKHHPVGIMVFGNADLIGVPWEVIIKVFRRRLRQRRFGTTREYAQAFIEFLEGNTKLFPPDAQRAAVRRSLITVFSFLNREMETASTAERQKQGLKEDQVLNDDDLSRIVEATIGALLAKIESAPLSPGRTGEDCGKFAETYADVINEIKDLVFKTRPFTTKAGEDLRRLSGLMFCQPASLFEASGVVVAGFGEDEIFPSLVSYQIFGVENDHLRYTDGHQIAITFDNEASIVPFAQKDMVVTFMEGMDERYREYFEQALSNLLMREYPEALGEIAGIPVGEQADDLKRKLVALGDGVRHKFFGAMELYRRTQNVAPIVDAVAFLPKDDIASLAESLVNPTSLKRRMTLAAETVGGPIDVAVISKGDGFIWMKRKHYFRPELNPQFFSNYNREYGDEEGAKAGTSRQGRKPSRRGRS